MAAELARRGYDVAAAERRSAADLRARSTRTGATFLVKVHGFRRPNAWILKPAQAEGDPYYVLTVVPAGGPNRFFVLSRAEALEEVERTLLRLGRTKDYPVHGFTFGTGLAYEDRWATLPR